MKNVNWPHCLASEIKSIEVVARGRKNSKWFPVHKITASIFLGKTLKQRKNKKGRSGYTQTPFRQKPYVFAFV